MSVAPQTEQEKLEKRQYDRNKFVNSEHGMEFEWNTTSLPYVRCEDLHQNPTEYEIEKSESFLMANNVEGLGVFDDVVVKVQYYIDAEGEKKQKVIFVQCKHVADPEKGIKYLFQKDRKDYFKSFVNLLLIVKKGVSGISSIGVKKIDSDRNKPPKNVTNPDTISKLKIKNEKLSQYLGKLLNCYISDCEFLLYTNAKIPENAKRKKDDANNCPDGGIDISHIIFDSADTSISHYSRPETLETLGLSGMIKHQDYTYYTEDGFEYLTEDDFEHLKKIFIEQFKIYCHQEVDIEMNIENLIESKYLSHNICEDLITEIQHHFRKAECTALSEESNLLSLVENYSKLNAKFTKEKEDFRSYLSSESIFSDSVTDLNNDIKKLRSQNKFRLSRKLERREIIRLSLYLNMTQREKTFVVFLDDDSDLETLKKARETNLYKKFKDVFIVCSGTLNERKENEFIINIDSPHDVDDQERNDEELAWEAGVEMVQEDGGEMVQVDYEEREREDGGEMVQVDGGEREREAGVEMVQEDVGEMVQVDGEEREREAGVEMIQVDGEEREREAGVEMIQVDGGEMVQVDGEEREREAGVEMVQVDGGEMVQVDGEEIVQVDGGEMDGEASRKRPMVDDEERDQKNTKKKARPADTGKEDKEGTGDS